MGMPVQKAMAYGWMLQDVVNYAVGLTDVD